MPTAMLCWQWTCRWAQPCALLLFLLGPQLLVTQDWDSQEEANDDQRASKNYFLATVEYGLHIFNLRSQDSNAYKVVRVLRSWKEPVDFGIVFSTELQLGRTRCGKFDEDIDNCPFQASPDVNNTITCFFTIITDPWRTKFQLLNNTCSEGSTE
ncbi:cystatin-9-like isoform X2 [Physeter macrocephalus]|uniref:Cystatin-9-like isoform X2 n=1 Tax=Physeter macrocephalus TaxID=9755 RepID=A0A455C0X3_PHYMC|nr:cystatin-9-like isoform X2 [Physeter catodon]|eukprot:XP_028354995.1 cystatin-9-like isoform X2 [Physeter catodon]